MFIVLVTGVLMHSTAEAGQDWDYFKFSKQFTPHMVPYGDNTFELVMRVRT